MARFILPIIFFDDAFLLYFLYSRSCDMMDIIFLAVAKITRNENVARRACHHFIYRSRPEIRPEMSISSITALLAWANYRR